ncbi:uncharacterized protein KY384_002514 [Bacidia gigantensis]|uniref:uncharacterized protein n=1 Tax=Bacidia gigantensis TaxID=2732470 RepID=UPI001D05B77E|nr:uncharacterized protein KY384_002514 [Bacidia gigantensis]KAG8532637.1 hypothetical protein KY384_002514 [Bacidia gigantensis]
MERSSPLAAVQPTAIPFWGCRADALPSYGDFKGNFPERFGFGPSNFNFKDLSMERAPMDYFNFKPIRGSSPTASLAADLSSNFHIDQSPQLPTPRRSLFSSSLFGTFNGREAARTPPLPSSSPGPGLESMEISPLPHKQPFVAETQIDTTPMETSIEEDEDIITANVVMQDSYTGSPGHGAIQPRPRASLLRSSLSRTKGFTTSAVSLKSARAEQPPFKFGNGVTLKFPPVMTPEQCFAASPQRDGRPQSADSPSSRPMGPPPKFRTSTSNLRGPPPPVSGHVRKPSNPMQRPRKQFRRSLSMFEHPEDVMKQQAAHFAVPRLDPVMDIDDPPRRQLPHFLLNDESLPRITRETMVDVLDGNFRQQYDEFLIVDCRFEYEYEGGHIDGAINYTDKEQLASRLFKNPCSGRTLIVFHCEYSACRAPLMAKHVRSSDRACNAHRYPNLTYPEMYILDGGYSLFFASHKLRCSPQDYVEMGDKKHENACERGMGRVKQQRTKLSRAQTFAFGQHEPPTDDSPTASSRRQRPVAGDLPRESSTDLVMDIEDILASVDDHALPTETTEVQQLARLWVAERSAPEIFPWPAALMDRMLERIKQQIEVVEEQTGNADPRANFHLIIIQTELERFKYLVRSFLRTRIAKIDAHPFYYLQTPAAKSLLSPSELYYLTTHTALLHDHYHSSFLSQFPQTLQKLDDKAAGGISMVEGPDVDKAVFVRCLKSMEESVEVPGTDIRLEMGRGDVVVTRWSVVREMVGKGECELV